MIIPFALSLFWGSLLLFFVEPMLARMIVPLLGGTPAVWTVCIVFFQGMLLLGYLYSHWITMRFQVRTQLLIHSLALFLPGIVLPIQISPTGAPTGGGNPSAWLFWLLICTVGLPFFVVSAGAPLTQKWFSLTKHPSAQDPYFLYAASNLGNMCALLLYPTIIEPRFRLATQSQLWAWGYALFALGSFFCIWYVWKYPDSLHPVDSSSKRVEAPALSSRQSLRQSFKWLAYAFVPSSLMLGTTSYLSTDIASIPLLWILPLGLYLLSFILVFSQSKWIPKKSLRFLMPVMVGIVFLITLWDNPPPAAIVIAIHLFSFFTVAMVCHGQLSASRPPIGQLTKFYLLLSAGGVLGGLFNALLAPSLFKTVIEYPLAMVMACLLLPPLFSRKEKNRRLFFDISAGIFILALTRYLFFRLEFVAGSFMSNLSANMKMIIEFLIPFLICFTFIFHPLRFRLSLAAFFVVLAVYSVSDDAVIFRDRSFFGCLSVTENKSGNFHELNHGTTLHGRQSLNPKYRYTPIIYYHPEGPIGQLYRKTELCQTALDIAVIGLGAGTLAAYAKPGQKVTFYEIDHAVEKVAEDANYFTYISDARARGAQVEIILGDARLKIAEAKDQIYSVIVIDAFSSDSIPIHLITKEALQVYLSKLTVDGILAFHISNRYVDLSPVLDRLGQDAGLAVLYAQDDDRSSEYRFPSSWVFLAHDIRSFRKLPINKSWQILRGNKPFPLWTDDFSNLLTLIIAG